MTIEEFKIKHADLITLGVITFYQTDEAHYITIDRFDGDIFLCEANKLTSSRQDAIKMGYTRSGFITGCYKKEMPHMNFKKAEEALLYLIIKGVGTTNTFSSDILNEIDKIKKPLVYNGVKLGMYFIWESYIFCQLMTICQYTGEINN